MHNTSINPKSIQEEWDKVNHCFENTAFVSESEIHMLATSGVETQFRQRHIQCRKNALTSAFNSLLLSIGVFSTDSHSGGFLFFMVASLWIVSLIVLTFFVYKLSLFYILNSPHIKLSVFGKVSGHLNRIDGMRFVRMLQRLDSNRITIKLSPLRFASTAASLAVLAICLIWNQSLGQINESSTLVAEVDSHLATIPSNAETSSPDELLVTYISPTEKIIASINGYDSSCQVPSNDISDVQQDKDAYADPLRGDVSQETLLAQSDPFVPSECPSTDTLSPSLTVICNKNICSASKYYGIFCENM